MSIDSLTSIQFLSIQDSLVVGQSDLVNHYDVVNDRQTECTSNESMLPFQSHLTVSNVKMVNFDKPGCVASGMLQYVSVKNNYTNFSFCSYETSVGFR